MNTDVMTVKSRKGIQSVIQRVYSVRKTCFSSLGPKGSFDWYGFVAMALVCVRVVVQVVWDWMVRSNSDLSALRITVLADAIVYAGCFWLIIARVRSRGVIGSIFLALCIAVMQFSSTQASNNALAIDRLVLLAVVHYRDWRLRGKLTLRGAETDTILFQLFDAEFLGVAPSASTEQDDAESSAPILFVRMPRSGLQGAYVGPWMAYFSYEDADLLSSDWVFIGEDGTAKIGYSEYLNAMTMTRGNLMEKTTTISWEETSEGVLLNAEE